MVFWCGCCACAQAVLAQSDLLRWSNVLFDLLCCLFYGSWCACTVRYMVRAYWYAVRLCGGSAGGAVAPYPSAVMGLCLHGVLRTVL